MKWLDAALTWMFPRFLLDNTGWEEGWVERERKGFVNLMRLALPWLAIGWFAHYFLYDLPMGLQPIEDWFQLRLIGTVVCITSFVFYLSKYANSLAIYRIPAIFSFALVIFLQSIAVKWHGEQTWIFLFLFTLAFSVILRMSSLSSAIFCTFCIGVSLKNMYEGGISTSNIVSGGLVTIGISMVVRTSYLLDIRNYILNRQHQETQEQLLSLSNEFSSRLRSFIPAVIARRIDEAIEKKGMSVLEASVDVLQAKKKHVACLFSDIRGFTQGSKELEKFIGNSVLPEVKACTDAIEKRDGIPRKIGDLIFAYFDDDSPQLNLIRAMLAGIEIARLNTDMNATAVNVRINRYILISTGEAIVGNLGGYDSSVEISALGSPVNFLSRVDDVTKIEAIARKINPGDLLLSKPAMDMIDSLLAETDIQLDYQEIDLKALDVQIRDFPETEYLYCIPSNERNYASLAAPLDYVNERVNGYAA